MSQLQVEEEIYQVSYNRSTRLYIQALPRAERCTNNSCLTVKVQQKGILKIQHIVSTHYLLKVVFFPFAQVRQW